MAYIPDDAILRSHTLTETANRLYALLCLRRDHTDGISRLTHKRAEDLLHKSKSTIYDAFLELKGEAKHKKRKNGTKILKTREIWIKEVGANEYVLLYGDFEPMRKKLKKNFSDSPENDQKNFDKNSDQPENFSDTPNKNSDRTEGISDTSESLNRNIQPLHPASSSSPHITAGQNGAAVVGVGQENFSENGAKPKSRYSIEECLEYAKKCKADGEDVRNPKGLATKIHRTGEADAFIMATLYPEEIEKTEYGKPREFSDELCSKCFGSTMERVEDGYESGVIPCTNCVNERGKRTGREPKK